MAWVPSELKTIAAQIHLSGPQVRTVRTILGWFQSYRRRYWVNATIRAALKEVGMKTRPDFEYVPTLDDYVFIEPVEAAVTAPAPVATTQSGTTSTITPPVIPSLSPATEVPATEFPPTGVPATEAPATEAPATEVPATEVPATEVPATEVPATEVSATEVPATEVPATEVPATGAPATGAPATGAPATGAPATGAPATGAPATGAPATGAPATEIRLSTTPVAVTVAVTPMPVAVVPETPVSTEVDPGSLPPAVDPLYLLKHVHSANKSVVRVPPNADLKAAITLMLSHDFSQLPVMTSDREVKGVVTWRSIAQRHAFALPCTTVQDCMIEYREIGIRASIFDATEIIAVAGYVLIRDEAKRISGIVTATDINRHFHGHAEPFLLLSEIENQLRLLVAPKFDRADLQSAKDPGDETRVVDEVSDLTMGEFVRLLENTEKWQKLRWPLDRIEFSKALKKIRDIRNDVMHFDPQGVDSDGVRHLRDFSRFLDQLTRLTS